MEVLKDLTEYGERLGYEGKELQDFVKNEQDRLREERLLQRDVEKDQIEKERLRMEHELHLKQIDHKHQLEMLDAKKKAEIVMGIFKKRSRVPNYRPLRKKPTI